MVPGPWAGRRGGGGSGGGGPALGGGGSRAGRARAGPLPLPRPRLLPSAEVAGPRAGLAGTPRPTGPELFLWGPQGGAGRSRLAGRAAQPPPAVPTLQNTPVPFPTLRGSAATFPPRVGAPGKDTTRTATVTWSRRRSDVLKGDKRSKKVYGTQSRGLLFTFRSLTSL